MEGLGQPSLCRQVVFQMYFISSFELLHPKTQRLSDLRGSGLDWGFSYSVNLD